MTNQKITTFLTFTDNAEEAVKLYASLFADGKILDTSRYGAGMPLPEGTVMTMSWQMGGQRYIALNAGQGFGFASGFSFYVDCEGQAEVDKLWDALLAGGGKTMACGWLTDKFGVCWQIIPTALTRGISHADPAVRGRVAQAMMQMIKIDVAAIEAAARG